MTSQRASSASLTIHNLDPWVEENLRLRAATNGRSVEDEARSILASTLITNVDETLNLAEAIRRHIIPLGGIDLEEHPPVPIGEPPDFG